MTSVPVSDQSNARIGDMHARGASTDSFIALVQLVGCGILGIECFDYMSC